MKNSNEMVLKNSNTRNSIRQTLLINKSIKREKIRVRYSRRLRKLPPSLTILHLKSQRLRKYIKRRKQQLLKNQPFIKKEPQNSNCETKSPNIQYTEPVEDQIIEDQLSYLHRRNYVMNVLNYGNIKDIEKLSSVGSKTAERIFLFRQVRGLFRDICELKDMPAWTGRKYYKFLLENYLKCDKSI